MEFFICPIIFLFLFYCVMLLFGGYNNFLIQGYYWGVFYFSFVYCSHLFQNYTSYMFLLLTCSGFPQNTDRGFPDGSVAPPANAGASGDLGSIPGSGRSPGEGNGNPLQNSCLENSTGGLQSSGSKRVRLRLSHWAQTQKPDNSSPFTSI